MTDQTSDPPRPQNAYMLFRQHVNEKINSMREGLPGLLQTNISKFTAKLWRQVPSETKRYFESKAREAAAEHRRRYPQYHYRPKSKKDRKRKPRPTPWWHIKPSIQPERVQTTSKSPSATPSPQLLQPDDQNIPLAHHIHPENVQDTKRPTTAWPSPQPSLLNGQSRPSLQSIQPGSAREMSEGLATPYFQPHLLYVYQPLLYPTYPSLPMVFLTPLLIPWVSQDYQSEPFSSLDLHHQLQDRTQPTTYHITHHRHAIRTDEAATIQGAGMDICQSDRVDGDGTGLEAKTVCSRAVNIEETRELYEKRFMEEIFSFSDFP
ncbi:hypothetical protein CPB84DRAFT_1555955 [Gymnopilus junonius]|uniref:HMG box domain-containing protein n=1 Tax=Gymnopilus junonius TaxID=109634 RepID=A0A9P5TIU2_GYMJU|nr:hypothetical protein CPB84DRAFT_1555955 [Gymnopilus junonius]